MGIKYTGKQTIAYALSKLREILDGYVKSDQLQDGIDSALKQAKDSGEFDGAPGSPGEKGDPGDDYTLTDADKTEIAAKVASEIDLSSYLPKSGGTMTGALVAQNNANYSVKQVRNVYIIADGDALPSGANGDICLTYTD